MRGLRVACVILCTLWVFGAVGQGKAVAGQDMVVSLPYGFGAEKPESGVLEFDFSGLANTIVFQGYILSYVQGGYSENQYLKIEKGDDYWVEKVSNVQYFYIKDGELWAKGYEGKWKVKIEQMGEREIKELK